MAEVTVGRRPPAGAIFAGIGVMVVTAGLLLLPLTLVTLGALAALSTWLPTMGDPTWNDGDAGLGLGLGGLSLLAVLAVASGLFVVLGRRFRLPSRWWTVGGVAGSLLLAGVVLWVVF
ncbi:MAG TPA: hypothetical protein VIT42_13210 [Microlunatus sp.]